MIRVPHFSRVLCARSGGFDFSRILLNQQIQRRRMRKLRRLPKPSMLRVKHTKSRLLNRRDDTRGNTPITSGERFRLRDSALHHLRLFDHVAILLLVSIGDADQYALEAGPPVAVRRRKIRPAVKRLAIGCKKSRERPPTLPAHRADRGLIAAVNVRTLISIHFYRNEMLIHNRRHFSVVIRLAIHHVAPVAPHRPNVEQHRLILALRRGERLLAPLMPLNRLVHGRPQIGGRSMSEGVEGGSGGHASSLYARRNPRERFIGGRPPPAVQADSLP